MLRPLSKVALGLVVGGSRNKTKDVEITFRKALFKTRINIISRSEVFHLKSFENRCLYFNRPFRMPYWIDSKTIVHGLYSSNNKKHLIFYDDVGELYPFSQHSTSVFIREIVVHKKPLEETTLYNSMSSGFARKLIVGGKRVRIPLNTRENMLLYYNKCQSLIENIQARGVEWLKDDNIGLTVTFQGRIAHFRCGHHRLAVAQALGIKSIPFDIILVSAKFLGERVPRWRLWNSSSMVRAVDEVLRHTMADFSRG